MSRANRLENAIRTGLAAALALSLVAVPVVAHAVEEASCSSAASAGAAASAEEAEGDTSASSASAAEEKDATTDDYGLYVAKEETGFANDASYSTSATLSGAYGMFAAGEGLIVANLVDVKTAGTGAAALATSANGGSISVANSTLQTDGAGSPLLQSAGTIEIDNVSATAKKAQIARLVGANSIMVAHSELTSEASKAAVGDPLASDVLIYQDKGRGASASESEMALFQMSDSTLQSSLDSGSVFYVTNAAANIVLSNDLLAFDSSKVKLLTVSGNGGTWGNSGKNGATAALTVLEQTLEGDIAVDSISSLDMYLLKGTTWTGTSAIVKNSAGTELTSNITVNIDAESGWTVTEDAMVSDLNIEKGAALVDAEGKAATIVDGDGNTLVDGASDVKVTVTGEFSTTVKTTDANGLQEASIDRSAFDEQFHTSTLFGTNGTGIADEGRVAVLKQIIVDWFANL